MANKRLGIGFIGSGFITRFHIQSLIAVRDADARGVWSPNKERAGAAADLARELRVGDCRAFDSIEEMVASPPRAVASEAPSISLFRRPRSLY
jgi:predicted dehydrogenase